MLITALNTHTHTHTGSGRSRQRSSFTMLDTVLFADEPPHQEEEGEANPAKHNTRTQNPQRDLNDPKPLNQKGW